MLNLEPVFYIPSNLNDILQGFITGSLQIADTEVKSKLIQFLEDSF